MIKVFVGGSRKLARLNDNIRGRLNNIIQNGYSILVGDANGVDKSVQKYLFDKGYRNVFVYCMGNNCRNNIGHWETRRIKEPNDIKDFRYYSIKDLEMIKETDYGFMIWDAKSKGTLNNIVYLLKESKSVVVYLSSDKRFYTLRTFEDLEKLLAKCDKKNLEIFEQKLKISQILKKAQRKEKWSLSNE